MQTKETTKITSNIMTKLQILPFGVFE